MKQRLLTEIQLTVLTMKLAGNSYFEISQVLHIHPATVSGKYAAIRRGISKDAYSNVPDVQNVNGDLFSSNLTES